jgi:hypothetical protein
MNRQKRRAAQSEHQRRSKLTAGIGHLSRSGPMQLIISATNRLRDPALDPEIFAAIMHLSAQVARGQRPLCLCCDFEWTNLRVPPPAGIAVVRTAKFFRNRGSGKVGIATGICRSCWDRPDLIEAALERYRRIWPSLSGHPDLHHAPAGRQ